MRIVSNFLAAALVAVAFTAPAAAMGMSGPTGGYGWSGGGGAGPILPQNGGGGPPPHGPPGLGPGYSGPNGFTPHSPSGPSGAFTPPHTGPTPPGVSGLGPGPGPGPDQRRRPRHYWLGNGPIFVPEPSGDYVYGDEDYDDGGDASGCWIYRKAYDRSGHFLGWVHIDTCESQ
jgi:hypothetical protein